MMRKKRLAKLSIISVTLSCILLSTASASYEPWNTIKADFMPDEGRITLSIPKSGTVQTYLSFRYSEDDALRIFADSYANVRAGMDVKNVPDGSEKMSAYLVTTSLPNPKTDIEDGNFFDSDGRNEEAEAVALGKIEAGSYYMSVMWNDYRTGATTDSGQFNVNAEHSKKGLSDYNVIDWLACTELPYGRYKGQE